MTRVILDCDPGHDDALAILLAAGNSDLEISAITTVAGNHHLELTTLNALRLASLAGIDAPVAAGCSHPLIRELLTAPEVHGEQGLEGHSWPPPTKTLEKEHGVDLIIDLLGSHPGEITLVPTGPLTNIALALRKEPRMVGWVREVVLMGGSYTRGNVTPAAEFNVFVDPEAAAIVFAAGWPLTMVGLDLTHQALATLEVRRQLAARPGSVAKAVTGLLQFYADSHRRLSGSDAPPVHDPCAVARVINPALVEVQAAHVEVEVASALTAGMTVTDFEASAERQNAQVATKLDAAGFWSLFAQAIDRLDARRSG